MIRSLIAHRRGTLLAIAAGAVILAAYFFLDPLSFKWMPRCAFKALTGLSCPGCGAQRMIHALLHGDFAAAWSANPFLLCAIPLLAFLAFASANRTRLPRLYARLNSLPAIIISATLLIAWGILRNLFGV